MTRRRRATAEELEAMAARIEAFEGSADEVNEELPEGFLADVRNTGWTYEFRLMGVTGTATHGRDGAMRAWARARRAAVRRRAS